MRLHGRYGISNLAIFPTIDPFFYVHLLLQTTARFLQWREKTMDPAESLPLLQLAVRLADERGKKIIVNSDPELVRASGAHGLHLTSSQFFPTALEREDHGIVGQSVHSLEEAVRAQENGLDYVLLSPVRHPISKETPFEPLGMEGLREATAKLDLPVFALGGIDLQSEPDVLAAGAAGVAGISWLAAEIRSLISKCDQRIRNASDGSSDL